MGQVLKRTGNCQKTTKAIGNYLGQHQVRFQVVIADEFRIKNLVKLVFESVYRNKN